MIRVLFIVSSCVFIANCSAPELKPVDASRIDQEKVFDLTGAVAVELRDVSVKQAKNCQLAYENSSESYSSLNAKQQQILLMLGRGTWGEVFKRAGAVISASERADFNARADDAKIQTYRRCLKHLTTALALVDVRKGMLDKNKKIENK